MFNCNAIIIRRSALPQKTDLDRAGSPWRRVEIELQAHHRLLFFNSIADQLLSTRAVFSLFTTAAVTPLSPTLHRASTHAEYSSMWVILLCLGLVAAPSAHAAAGSLRCQPQGLLKLDKPYPPPRQIELPFCQQYGCSCCNASHALTLQRASRVIAEDEDLSQDCKLGLLRLICRVCDPQVCVDGCVLSQSVWPAG